MSTHISPQPLGAQLLRKYQAAIPRYTSYPTAPNFSAEYDQNSYLADLAKSNQALLPRKLSLYIHIPFCQSLCYFCGCNKVITQTNHAKIERYLELLHAEISMRSKLFDQDRRVAQIHFGGGTPNFLGNQKLRDVLETIANGFHLDLPSKLEVGIEIDPRMINAEGIYELADFGFNRFSIGVQDFSPEVQKAINRFQSEQQTLEVIRAATEVSDSVNVDLITGLPRQTVATFQETLNKVIDSGVDRVAAYNFAYLPDRIKPQRLISPQQLPSAKQRIELAELARHSLLKAGYEHIGMDHFATPNDSLSKAAKNDTLQRNFQGYTTNAETDLVGFGVSAISQFNNAFAQNSTNIKSYAQSITARELPIVRGVSLDDDDILRADVIQQIMCKTHVDMAKLVRHIVSSTSELSLFEYFSHELNLLAPLLADGLISKTESGFRICAEGRFFRRQIAAKFDAYLATNTIEQNGNKPSESNIVQFSQSL